MTVVVSATVVKEMMFDLKRMDLELGFLRKHVEILTERLNAVEKQPIIKPIGYTLPKILPQKVTIDPNPKLPNYIPDNVVALFNRPKG